MTDRTCLTGNTTANNIYEYVVFAFGFSNFKRLVNDEFQCFQTKIIGQLTAVNNDFTFTRMQLKNLKL